VERSRCHRIMRLKAYKAATRSAAFTSACLASITALNISVPFKSGEGQMTVVSPNTLVTQSGGERG